MHTKLVEKTKKDELLCFHTSIRTGGPADYFVVPRDIAELLKVMETIRDSSLPGFVIGEGTNLLFSDDGFRGCVVKLGRNFEDLRISGQRIFAGAALKLGKLIHESVGNSLSGLECLYGIPGTVGGAVSTNAGAYGIQFGDFIESITGIDEFVKPVRFGRNEIESEYRTALQPEEIVVTEVVLKLTRGSASRSLRIMGDCLEKRRAAQPWNESTAGCVFKNPAPDLQAGKVIEECGLKGKEVGDAMISPKHCNFIVNKGRATTAQIVSLIEIVVDEVRRKTGIELRLEVEVVG